MSLGSQGSFFLGSSGQGGGGYAIERSLRFDSTASSYLNRTPSSAGNRKTWTWSGWVKKSEISNRQYIFTSGITVASDSSYFRLFFQNDDVFYVGSYSANYIITDAVFRDPSAWYHIVIALDTSNATAEDRCIMYVNGVRQSTSGGSTIPQNTEYGINSTESHNISGDTFFNGYLADIHFIDGQALSATDFGEFDSNSVWQPKVFEGTYGTNGFKLDFSDTSSNSALGTDSSGQGNNWTVNNLVAAGLDMDQSQTWSTYGSPSSGGYAPGFGIARGFDGNTATQVEGDTTDAYFSIPYSATVAVGGVGFFTYASGSSGKMKVYNGATLVETVDSSTGGNWRYTSSYSGAITEIRISRDSRAFEFAAVSVNGKVLVDAGVPDPLGATIDALRDTPVNGNSASDTGAGGEITGNYATLNPLVKTSTTVLANGNLDVTSTGQLNAVSTFVPSSGKWYWEVQLGSIVTNSFIGLYGTTPLNSSYLAYGINGYGLLNTGWGSASSTVSGTGVAGDFIGLALDVDAKTLEYYKNGSSIGTISGFTFVENWSFGISCNVTVSTPWVFNFGQRSWAYAAPTNFKALCTANLSDPLIADGSTAFDTKLYTGNDPGTQSITTSFSPDLVWLKTRSTSGDHRLFDTVRGNTKHLECSNNVEQTEPYMITSFNSDGFTLGGDDKTNASGVTYAAWAWDAGSSTVTNTDGSISSQVRANPSAGFSIVSYTGTGSAATVGHGLNAAPEMILLKDRNVEAKWKVLHVGAVSGADAYYQNVLHLNTNESFTGTGNTYPWGGTAPTSSVFSVANASTEANRSGSINNTNYIAYCFAPVSGYSSFGAYTGNGSATDGPFVFLNFAPAFLLVKRTDSTGNWILVDQTRGEDKALYPNQTISEASASFTWVDFVSNGFKIRNSGGAVNASGGNYIYWAVAKNPFSSNGGLAR